MGSNLLRIALGVALTFTGRVCDVRDEPDPSQRGATAARAGWREGVAPGGAVRALETKPAGADRFE